MKGTRASPRGTNDPAVQGQTRQWVSGGFVVVAGLASALVFWVERLQLWRSKSLWSLLMGPLCLHT